MNGMLRKGDYKMDYFNWNIDNIKCDSFDHLNVPRNLLINQEFFKPFKILSNDLKWLINLFMFE